MTAAPAMVRPRLPRARRLPPGAPVRPPSPRLWHVATVAGRRVHPLTGQRVVVAAITPSATLSGPPGITVTGRAITGPAAGRIVRETLPATALRFLPSPYRVRPCMDPCGATGTCWVLSRPDLPDDHRDTLDGALIGATAHHDARTR